MAAIVAVTSAETAFVTTVKLAEIEPPATVTWLGTMASPLEEASVTTSPPEGAGPLIVTAPVALLPPTTGLGSTVRYVTDAGWIVRGVLTVVPFKVAEIVAVVLAVSDTVVTVKVSVDWPAAMSTWAGTDAPEVEDRLTATPPDGAGRTNVTVPVTELPPATMFG